MARIDDYYNAINEKIDRSISELTAIKNYELIHADYLDLLAENYELGVDYFKVIKDLKMASDRLKKLNTIIDNLLQLLQMQYARTTKDLVKQDLEIRQLKKGRDFLHSITSDPYKVEDTKSP